MHGQTKTGKGDTYRPVDRKKWDKNYDETFKNNFKWYYSRTKKKWVSIEVGKHFGEI